MANGRRRGHGEGSIYEKDGRWIAALSLRGGRRKYFSAKTRREAVQKLQAAQREQERGMPVASGQQKLDAFLESWLRDKTNLRIESVRTYESLIRGWIIPQLGKLRVTELEPAHVRGLVSAMHKAGKSPGTQHTVLRILSAALHQAEREEIVGRNVARLVTPPTSKPAGRRLDPDEARRLREACSSHRLGALVLVGLALGLRNAEVRALRWLDHPATTARKSPVSTVDLDARRIVVRVQLSRDYEDVPLKTEAGARVMQLPEGLVLALRRWRTTQREEQLAAGGLWANTGYVFTTRAGRPYRERIPIETVRAICVGAGLPPLRFHDLRHSAATLLLNRRGVDSKDVSWSLGHANLQTTVNIYGQPQDEHAAEVARHMQELLWDEQTS